MHFSASLLLYYFFTQASTLLLCLINTLNFLAHSRNCEKQLLTFSCQPYVWSAWNILAPSRQILLKFDIWGFFKTPLRKFRFLYNLIRLTDIAHEDLCTFLIISYLLLRMRNVSDKSCRQNQNIFYFQYVLSQKLSCLWHNVKKYGCVRQAANGNIIRSREDAFFLAG